MLNGVNIGVPLFCQRYFYVTIDITYESEAFIKIDRIILQNSLDWNEENVPVAADMSNDGNILICYGKWSQQH